MAINTMKQWLGNVYFPCDIEYIFSIDNDDPQSGEYHARVNIHNHDNPEKPVAVTSRHNLSAIEAINNAAMVCTGDLIIVASDDFAAPHRWDESLKHFLKNKKDFLVKTNDGLQPTLITLPIMDRTYYNRFGYVYYPGYKHMFCDQEMTAVGHMLGKIIDLQEFGLTFRHNHYTTGAMKRDDINIKNDSTWQQGQELFNNRLNKLFDLKKEEIVKPYDQIKWR